MLQKQFSCYFLGYPEGTIYVKYCEHHKWNYIHVHLLGLEAEIFKIFFIFYLNYEICMAGHHFGKVRKYGLWFGWTDPF